MIIKFAVASAAKILLTSKRQLVQPASALHGGTHQGVKVVRLVAAGSPNNQLAEALYLSLHTVHHHVANALAQLGNHRRTAPAIAGSLGLAPPVTSGETASRSHSGA